MDILLLKVGCVSCVLSLKIKTHFFKCYKNAAHFLRVMDFILFGFQIQIWDSGLGFRIRIQIWDLSPNSGTNSKNQI